MYLLNLSLQHYRFIAYRPALLALSAFVLSSASIRSTGHPAHIQLMSLCPSLYECSHTELLECELQLYEAWLSMALVEGAEQHGSHRCAKYRAVERKFTQREVLRSESTAVGAASHVEWLGDIGRDSTRKGRRYRSSKSTTGATRRSVLEVCYVCWLLA